MSFPYFARAAAHLQFSRAISIRVTADPRPSRRTGIAEGFQELNFF
jgi:hypothetical protein